MVIGQPTPQPKYKPGQDALARIKNNPDSTVGKTNVSINPDNIVTGINGQVAIRGGASAIRTTPIGEQNNANSNTTPEGYGTYQNAQGQPMSGKLPTNVS